MPDEPQIWPVETEALLSDLRRQIEAARSRLCEHREQMQAAGLARPDPDPSDADASA